MAPVTRIWLLHALFGLALAQLTLYLQNTLVGREYISAEGVVFGCMAAMMAVAVRKVERRHRGIFQ